VILKKLDSVTLRAITQIITKQYFVYDPQGEVRFAEFFIRSGVTVDPDVLGSIPRNSNPVPTVVNSLNGTDDFERLLLRLASPKEHAGNRGSIDRMVRELNEALWPESLRIEFTGVEPRVTERSETPLINLPVRARRKKNATDPAGNQATMNDQIFIIHGRDIGIKDTVARLIDDLGLKPIVLQELPNRGRTIIEKIEDYAQVQFAVAIFSPDDQGALSDDTKHLRPRSRQNVIFEFGYFIGKLGRHRACALIKSDVEIPSDHSGVLYIQMDDSDGWKFKLVQELQSAGYEVDANDLTRRQ
jgi:predicted nucleotide-binding protein